MTRQRTQERGKPSGMIFIKGKNQWQTDQMIAYLEENGLIEGYKSEGYYLTKTRSGMTY